MGHAADRAPAAALARILNMATRGPFTEYDWAGETIYNVDKVARLFVHHAELAALARGALDDANPVVPDPEAVKETMVEKEVTAAGTPGPAAATAHGRAERRSTMRTR
jgi:hypothetical protein